MNQLEIKYLNILKWLFLLLTIPSLAQWSKMPLPSFSEYLWWLLYMVILFCMYKLKPLKDEYKSSIINIWFVFILFHLIYGFYMCEDYWDAKQLINNSFVFFIPLLVLSLYTPMRCVYLMSFWLRNAWILFLLYIAPFIIENDALGKFSAPFTFVLLFFPLVKGKTRLITLLVVLLVILFNLDDRSDSIKILVCFLISLIPRVGLLRRTSNLTFTVGRILLLIMPFVFCTLGASGVFNVFSFDTYINGDYSIQNKAGENENLLADSRTMLYEEAIVSAVNNNYVIQGRSMSRGYDTSFFAYIYDTDNYSGRYGERRSAEALIVSVFTYFGVIGVVLIFIIFWSASKKAIYESNNIYIKCLGLYIAFRWVWLWVEDNFKFDINTFVLWIMLAMCFSPEWRTLTDDNFEDYYKII